MLKKIVVLSVASLVLPLSVSAAGSVYGRALQKARNVAGQAEKSRAALPDDDRPASPKPAAPDALDRAKQFSAAVAKLETYPPTGAKGVNELLAKKLADPASLGLAAGRTNITEKELSIAWFGTEANSARGKGVFPLFISKPAKGAVVVGFTDGSVKRLDNRPRGVTGVISILRAQSSDGRDPLWESYRKAARAIDRAAK
ncbi:MAG: hypothetical protein IJU70_07970 [Lentisphaeria bacterium]|nr:hypothetical protein [Lentisphaeria bacterium]